MEQYVGLDVSLKETHYCVMDSAGDVVARGREVTHPELLARALGRDAPAARVVVLETGSHPIGAKPSSTTRMERIRSSLK